MQGNIQAYEALSTVSISFVVARVYHRALVCRVDNRRAIVLWHYRHPEGHDWGSCE